MKFAAPKQTLLAGLITLASMLSLASSAEHENQSNLDFSSKSAGWQITNASSPRAQSKPRPKPQSTWLPVNTSPAAGNGSSSFAFDPSYQGSLQEQYHSQVPLDWLLAGKASAGDSKEGLALEKQGIKYGNQGNYTLALVTLKAAEKLIPNRSILAYNIGVVEEHLGLWSMALKEFEKASRLNPTSAHAALEKARCHAVMGKLDQAVAIINEHKWSPTDYARKAGLAGVCILTGDKELSFKSNIRQLAADDDVFLGASNAIRARRIEAAKALIIEYEHRQPFAANTYLLKAQMQDMEGHYEESLAALKEADHLAPGNATVMLKLIKAYMELGQLAEMDRAQKRFRATFPDDPRGGSQLQEKDLSSYQTGKVQDRKNFEKMPIVVYVPDLQTASLSWERKPDRNVDFTNLLRKACNDWESASYQKVTFQFMANQASEYTIDLTKSRIQVRWVSDQQQFTSHSDAVGLTQYVPDGRGGLYCIVNLMVATDPGKTNAQEFYEVALHELGHALGLSHSPSPDDIMYFSQHGTFKERSLSTQDRSRICNVYN